MPTYTTAVKINNQVSQSNGLNSVLDPLIGSHVTVILEIDARLKECESVECKGFA